MIKFLNSLLRNQDIVLDELNVKSIERISEASNLIEYKIKPNLRTLGQKYGSGLSKIKEILDESNVDFLVKRMKIDNHIILNNKYKLEREDVFIETTPAEGFSAASDSGITVGLSLDLNQRFNFRRYCARYCKSYTVNEEKSWIRCRR